MKPAPEINPAPAPMAPQVEQSHSLVLVSGLLTTGLALFGVYLLDTRTEDFHIMGWYANYILPVGALLVGLVAPSGYGLASWVAEVKQTDFARADLHPEFVRVLLPSPTGSSIKPA